MLPILTVDPRSAHKPILVENLTLESLIRNQFDILETFPGQEKDLDNQKIYALRYQLIDKKNNSKSLSEESIITAHDFNTFTMNENSSLNYARTLLTELTPGVIFFTTLKKFNQNLWYITCWTLSPLGKTKRYTAEYQANGQINNLSTSPTQYHGYLTLIANLLTTNTDTLKQHNICRLEGIIEDKNIKLTSLGIEQQPGTMVDLRHQPDKLSDAPTKTVNMSWTKKLIEKLKPKTTYFDINSSAYQENKSSAMHICICHPEYLTRVAKGHSSLTEIISHAIGDQSYESLLYLSGYAGINNPQALRLSELQGAHAIRKDTAFFLKEMTALKHLRQKKQIMITWYGITHVRQPDEVKDILAIARKAGLSRSPHARFAISLDTFSSILLLDDCLAPGIDAVIIQPSTLIQAIYAVDLPRALEISANRQEDLSKILDHLQEITRKHKIPVLCRIVNQVDEAYYFQHQQHHWLAVLES